MKYALENIETLIQTELHPDVVQLKQPAVDDLSDYISKITTEKNRVKSILKKEFFSCIEEKSVELFVQHNQTTLINLADDLIHAIRSIEAYQSNRKKDNVSLITVYHHFLQCIEELLTFIERHFNRYFNIDEKIPMSYKLLMQSEFSLHLNELSILYKFPNIDSKLADIMLEPFRQFVNIETSVPVTYRELFYLKTLNKEYSRILLQGQDGEMQTSFIGQLLYLNYNNTAFINYYIQIIAKDMEEAGTIFEEMEKLAWWFKTVKQVQTKPETAYKIKDSSAKEQLLNWIEVEMTFIEKKHQLNLEMPLPTESIDPPLLNIFTAFSVRQVALFARLLIDAEYIKTDNQKEMLTALAHVLQTENTKNISPVNLRAKYYDIDEPTKNALKGCLIKLIDQLRKY